MISDYLIGIRNRIGNDFLLLPSVSVIVEDDNRRILMVRHHHNDWWVLPGGMIEPDETPQQAAIREIKEETGVDVKPQNIHGVFGGEEFRIQYANGDCVGYVMIVFLAKIISGEPCPDGNEIRQVEFMSLDTIRGLNTAKWVKTVLSEFTNHV